MKKPILFVAAGLAQAPAIREAREAGYFTVAMDASPTAPGFAEADRVIIGDILDSAEIVKAARETGAEAILSVCCDVAMEAVAAACEELSLPGIPRDVVRTSRNKLLQRQAMDAAGLPVPLFRAVKTEAETFSAWDEFAVDAVVVKPVDSSGSRGVSFVNERGNLPAALDLALSASPSRTALVESFEPGVEYSVEAWVVGDSIYVLATSVKKRTSPPYLLDREVHFPDDLSEADHRTLLDHARKTIRACGFRDCPVHLECLWTPRGPIVVELAARGAGFKVFTEILPRITGISTAAASLNCAFGLEPDLTARQALSAASLVFVDPVPGEFIEAEGLDAARALPGVVEIAIYPKPGQRMHPLRSGSDRAGHILAYGPDPVTCTSTAQAARDSIHLIVRS
jgi:biotin carboxylase